MVVTVTTAAPISAQVVAVERLGLARMGQARLAATVEPVKRHQ
jgi:hypothetical protein